MSKKIIRWKNIQIIFSELKILETEKLKQIRSDLFKTANVVGNLLYLRPGLNSPNANIYWDGVHLTLYTCKKLSHEDLRQLYYDLYEASSTISTLLNFRKSSEKFPKP